MKLQAVQKSIEKKFEEALGSPYAFDFHGLERGGHHAVLNWVLTLTGEPFMHVARAHSKHPASMRYHPSGWYTTHLPPPRGVGLTYSPDQDLLCAPSRINQERVIVCVRDIRNVIASRLRWYNNRSDSDIGPVFGIDGGTIDVWHRYAQQALGDEDFFNDRCVSVVFDHWARDETYRLGLIRQLNARFNWDLPETPNVAMERTAQAGGGSSFDGLTLSDRASEMEVTERWKAYENHPLMVKLMNSEITALNGRLIHGTFG